MRVKFNGAPPIARHHNCPTHIQQTVSFNRYFEVASQYKIKMKVINFLLKQNCLSQKISLKSPCKTNKTKYFRLRWYDKV